MPPHSFCVRRLFLHRAHFLLLDLAGVTCRAFAASELGFFADLSPATYSAHNLSDGLLAGVRLGAFKRPCSISARLIPKSNTSLPHRPPNDLCNLFYIYGIVALEYWYSPCSSYPGSLRRTSHLRTRQGYSFRQVRVGCYHPHPVRMSPSGDRAIRRFGTAF